MESKCRDSGQRNNSEDPVIEGKRQRMMSRVIANWVWVARGRARKRITIGGPLSRGNVYGPSGPQLRNITARETKEEAKKENSKRNGTHGVRLSIPA